MSNKPAAPVSVQGEAKDPRGDVIKMRVDYGDEYETMPVQYRVALTRKDGSTRAEFMTQKEINRVKGVVKQNGGGDDDGVDGKKKQKEQEEEDIVAELQESLTLTHQLQVLKASQDFDDCYELCNDLVNTMKLVRERLGKLKDLPPSVFQQVRDILDLFPKE